MGAVFRLWVLAIAVQVYACFVLLLQVAGEPARHDLSFVPPVMLLCTTSSICLAR